MVRAYISVGSNIDRSKNIRRAIKLLRKNFAGLMLSPLYESHAQGFSGEPFYNLVASVETDRTVAETVAVLAEIEKLCGRCRDGPRFGPRTLDLDLVSYGCTKGKTDGVELPREEVLHCDFVLKPMADLAPAECHPVLGLSWRELWQCFAAAPPMDSQLRAIETDFSGSGSDHRRRSGSDL